MIPRRPTAAATAAAAAAAAAAATAAAAAATARVAARAAGAAPLASTQRRCTAVAVIGTALLALGLSLAGGASAGPVEEGRLCLRGSERTPANLPRAFQLFSAAAQKGDPQAAYYLGMMYQNGMAVARDTKAAARWLQFAANRQTPAAMFALAKLYLAGDGVKRDDIAARRWIEKAADLEYPEAVMAMAIGLRDGSMGFERNEALAETQMRFANRALKQASPGM
ncbi:Sel1 repeat-containing protein [Duganella sp. OV458]|nr:Sel1 repeat-containing protein [Duganella sp. OV458]SDJ79373.1 Sel1 repeat-containing protein [Duganella sp. OV510]